jgi:hypothetical protein
MLNMTDELILGDNKYTKIKYTALESAEVGSKYLLFVSSKDGDKLEKLYLWALKKTSVNGEPLDTELKINAHFSKFPKEIRPARIWALQEGLHDFLESWFPTEDLGEKYWGF